MDRNKLRKLLIYELRMDSSESSSDEEEMAILLENQLENQLVVQRVPSVNVKNFIEDVVNKCSDTQFQKDFRLSRETCDLLIEQYASSQYYKDDNIRGRPRKSAKTHFLSFLWYAANKSTLRATSRMFDMSVSTLHYSMEHVMDYLLSIAPSVVVFPHTEINKLHAAHEFSQISGIPGVVGAIDECLINIRCPKNKIPSTYVNRHDNISMTLQAICDSEKRFLDVFTGVPSKIHDSRVFQDSFIYPIVHQLGENYHLIADAAYGLSENVLTPYRDCGALTVEQRNFNYNFCRTRVKIENAFALLQARFGSLIRLDFHTPLKDAKFIMSCTVLHNLGIDGAQFLRNRLQMHEIHLNEGDQLVPIHLNRAAGEGKRNQIAADFVQNNQ